MIQASNRLTAGAAGGRWRSVPFWRRPGKSRKEPPKRLTRRFALPSAG